MPIRRAHTKSRNGCLGCKKRHLKCDETGPPCTNCIIKESECTYTRTEETQSASISSKSKDSPSTSTSQPSPKQNFGGGHANRLLELELMHQWSVSTYKALCSREEELFVWQVMVPRDAFNHEFLLNGVFAFTCLDIAVNVKPDQFHDYIRAALEYQNEASTTFRSQLSNITDLNHSVLVMSSLITCVLNVALSQCLPNEHSMVGTMTLIFDLMQGSESILGTDKDRIQASPYAQAMSKVVEEFSAAAPFSALENPTRIAIDRLSEVNEEHYQNARDKSRDSHWKAMEIHSTCRKAIFQLEECFARCTDPSQEAMFLAWPLQAGPDFAAAVKRSDSVALYVLMHWGVLLERHTKDLWWARSSGEKLVHELSNTLLCDESSSLWKDGILWARENVGLPLEL